MVLFGFGILISLPLLGVPFILSIVRYINYHKWIKSNDPLPNTINDYTTVLDEPTRLGVAYEKWIYKWEFPEFLFMGLAPIAGAAFIYIFQKEIEPFYTPYAPTLIVYIIMAYGCYWASRIFKERLPNAINMILPYGMLMGVVLYTVLFIHFLSPLTLLGGAVLPYFAFPLFAPLPALLYTLRQIKQHNRFAITQTSALWATFNQSSPEREWFRQLWWHEGFPNPVFLLGMILSIQIGLYHIGQPFDAIIEVFRQSKGFLLSNDLSFLDW